MRKTRVFGQLVGVQGMVIGDVTVQVDPDLGGVGTPRRSVREQVRAMPATVPGI